MPPGWELDVFGGTVTLAVLVPLAVIGAFLLSVAVYPFVEGWILRDRADHHILDRPRNVPTRTALGVGALTFYGVLWAAASSDLMSTHLHIALEAVIIGFQVLLIAGPPIAFGVARAVCLGLQRKDREVLAHGYETGRIVRMPGGEYVEQHGALDAGERARIADGTRYAPLRLRPERDGRILLRERVRVGLSRLFLRERVASVTAAIPIDPAPNRDAA